MTHLSRESGFPPQGAVTGARILTSQHSPGHSQRNTKDFSRQENFFEQERVPGRDSFPVYLSRKSCKRRVYVLFGMLKATSNELYEIIPVHDLH
jgi:hypothetical protein